MEYKRFTAINIAMTNALIQRTALQSHVRQIIVSATAIEFVTNIKAYVKRLTQGRLWYAANALPVGR